MKLKITAIVVMVFLAVFRVEANGIDFRLSSKTAEFLFLTESSSFGYGGADIGFGLFINENDDLIGSGSILVTGSSAGDVRALHFGVGAKVYAGALDTPSNDSGGGLAIGGQVRYVFPASTPLAILVEGFVAPSVVSLSDFEGIRDFRIALELEVTPSARAYVGYRNFQVELNNGFDYELDDSAHVGVRFSF
jgi:hypothetical protein